MYFTGKGEGLHEIVVIDVCSECNFCKVAQNTEKRGMRKIGKLGYTIRTRCKMKAINRTLRNHQFVFDGATSLGSLV